MIDFRHIALFAVALSCAVNGIAAAPKPAAEHAADAASSAANAAACASQEVNPLDFVPVVGQHDHDALAAALRALRANGTGALEKHPGYEEVIDMFVRMQRRHEDALRAKCVRTAGQLARILLGGPLGEGVDEATREKIAHLSRIRGLHHQTMVRLLNEGIDRVVASLHVKDISVDELKGELARRETTSAPLVGRLHMTMIRNFILQDLLEKGLYRIEDKDKQFDYLAKNIVPYLALRSNQDLVALVRDIEKRDHPSEIETAFVWAVKGVMRQREAEGKEHTKTSAALMKLMVDTQLAAAKEFARADGLDVNAIFGKGAKTKGGAKASRHAAGTHEAEIDTVVPAGSLRPEDARAFAASVQSNLRKFDKEKLRPLFEQLAKVVDVRKDSRGRTHYVRRTGEEADRAQADLLRDWGSDLPWMMSAERATTLTTGKHSPWSTPVTSLGAVMAVAVSQPGSDGKRVIHFPSNPSHDIVLPNDTDVGIVTALSSEEPAAAPVRLAANDAVPYGSGAGVYDTSFGNESFNNDRPSTANGFNKGYAPQTAASDPPKGLFPPQKAERDAERARSAKLDAASTAADRIDRVPSNPGVADNHGRVDSPDSGASGSGYSPGFAAGTGNSPSSVPVGPEQPSPIRRRAGPRALPFGGGGQNEIGEVAARPRRAPVRNLAAPPDSFGEAAARAEEANAKADAQNGRTVARDNPPPPPESPPQAYAPPPPPPSYGVAPVPKLSEATYTPSAPSVTAASTPAPTAEPVAAGSATPVGVPTTTSIDTTVATDDARRPVRTTTVVQEYEVGTGKPVKKTVKETQLEPETQKPTKVTETTTEYDPASHKDKKITKVEMDLDPTSQRTTKVTETVREFDAKSHDEATVTKTVTDMDSTNGKPRIRVQTVKTIDARTRNPSRVMVVTSQIDVPTQRITQKTTTTSDFEPASQKLISKTTRVQYGDKLTKGFGAAPVTAGN